MDNTYTGYIELTDSEAANFYMNKTLNKQPLENQYVIIGSDLFCYQNGNYRRVEYPIIHSEWAGEIKPKENYQKMALDMLGDRQSSVKVIRGVYGSGKDYLMFNKAMSLIEQGVFEKIIYVRPNVTLANVPQIGYLPNGIDDKLAWTLAPLYDKVGGEDGVDQLVKQKILEMVPLLFIRGRSFENSIVYVTEAQNIDSEIAKVLISRVGQGSELWLNGDNHQCDSRIFDKDNGLTKMINRLSGNPLFAYTYLPITHRSDVANLANLLDD